MLRGGFTYWNPIHCIVHAMLFRAWHPNTKSLITAQCSMDVNAIKTQEQRFSLSSLIILVILFILRNHSNKALRSSGSRLNKEHFQQKQWAFGLLRIVCSMERTSKPMKNLGSVPRLIPLAPHLPPPAFPALPWLPASSLLPPFPFQLSFSPLGKGTNLKTLIKHKTTKRLGFILDL